MTEKRLTKCLLPSQVQTNKHPNTLFRVSIAKDRNRQLTTGQRESGLPGRGGQQPGGNQTRERRPAQREPDDQGRHQKHTG